MVGFLKFTEESKLIIFVNENKSHMVPEGDPGQKKSTIQVSYLSEIVSTSRFGICKIWIISLGSEWENLRFIRRNGRKSTFEWPKVVSEVIFPRFWGVVCIENCFRNFEIVVGSAVSEISQFGPFCSVYYYLEVFHQMRFLLANNHLTVSFFHLLLQFFVVVVFHTGNRFCSVYIVGFCNL